VKGGFERAAAGLSCRPRPWYRLNMRNRLLLATGFVLVVFAVLLAACKPGPPPNNAPSGTADTSTVTNGVDPSKQFAAPDQVLVAGKQYTATIVTDKGTIVIALDAEKAPRTVNSFVFLAQKGFYDGLKFHRVEPGFVVQGGDPLGNGSGGPGYSVEEDQNDLLNVTGAISMATTAGSTKVGSQFFINLVDNTSLDQASATQPRFYPFGKVTGGMDVVNKLAVGDVMKTVTISSN
jgi:peptidyl-prolyl cis-trans isomerase B (cyclophilin B)